MGYFKSQILDQILHETSTFSLTSTNSPAFSTVLVIFEVTTGWHVTGCLHSSEDELGCLGWSLYLEEGVRMVDLTLTSLTVVEVLTHTALVSDTNHGEGITTVTSDISMNSGTVSFPNKGTLSFLNKGTFRFLNNWF